MDMDNYFWKTKKRPIKTKPRNKPLPKAKEKYLEAEELLFQELEEYLISYRRKFQFELTKNWRFDFYIVKLNLLIEIAGCRSGTLADNGFTGAIILDDPLKPEDAFSKTARNKANRKILNTVNSRKARSSTPIILIMQRLHVEDPTNFVMTGNVPGDWQQISILALIDDEYINTLPEHIRKKVLRDVEEDDLFADLQNFPQGGKAALID